MLAYTLQVIENDKNDEDQFAIFDGEAMHKDNCSFAYGVERKDIIIEIEHFRVSGNNDCVNFIAEQFTFND